MKTPRAAVLLSLLLLVGFPRTVAAEDPDLKARKHFAAGEYREALDIYAGLYAETLHPTYLRNVGRCYQNMHEPDKAIDSFREYLRKAKNLSAAQRAEIDGYIAEMEDLKRSRAPVVVEPMPKPVPTPSVPAAWPPASASGPVSHPLLGSSSPVARDEDTVARPGPFYTRLWFWAGVGVVVAAGVTTAVLLSADRLPGHGNVGLVDLRAQGR